MDEYVLGEQYQDRTTKSTFLKGGAKLEQTGINFAPLFLLNFIRKVDLEQTGFNFCSTFLKVDLEQT